MRKLLSILAIVLWCPELAAQPAAANPGALPNIRMWTAGGKQFWADELVYDEWRIQRNVLTGSCRLLDPDNVRHAWGTFDGCQAEFAAIAVDRDLEPPSGRVVVLLHGVGSSRKVMARLARELRLADYNVVNVGYPSTRGGVEMHAATLAKVIHSLGAQVRELHFVTHSLGSLVVRQYLHQQRAQGQLDPRVGRFVMLGPPNRGAALARMFQHLPLFDVVLHGSGDQIADGVDHLGEPPCEFGIVAGGKSDDRGWNPLLEGDDDLIVRVAETRLAGARDFLLVPARHKQLPSDPVVIQSTLHFLRHGRFLPSRQPADDASGDDAPRQ